MKSCYLRNPKNRNVDIFYLWCILFIFFLLLFSWFSGQCMLCFPLLCGYHNTTIHSCHFYKSCLPTSSTVRSPFLPVDLFLNFEKLSWETQVWKTGFLVCKNQFQNWFLQGTQAVKIHFEIDEHDFSKLKSSTVQQRVYCDSKSILGKHQRNHQSLCLSLDV